MTIEINQKELISLFEYKDGSLIWKADHGKNKTMGRIAGCKTSDGYTRIRINNRLYLAHRLIWIFHHGYCPKILDHINGKRYDNRIENLRAATRSNNGMNAQLSKKNSSGIKGVSWHKASNKWRVSLSIAGHNTHIGCFDDIDLAILVADEAREKHHGIFARNH
jgi:hypothetical protein